MQKLKLENQCQAFSSDIQHQRSETWPFWRLNIEDLIVLALQYYHKEDRECSEWYCDGRFSIDMDSSVTLNSSKCSILSGDFSV